MLIDDGNYLEENRDQEEKFQENVQSSLAINTLLEDEETAEKPMPKPEPVFDKAGRERWPRDAQLAAKALRLSGYKCAYDETYTSFTSKSQVKDTWKYTILCQ